MQEAVVVDLSISLQLFSFHVHFHFPFRFRLHHTALRWVCILVVGLLGCWVHGWLAGCLGT